MSKILQFNTEARNKIKKGVDALAGAVKVTLGPKGRNVVIERKYGGPSVTKDGVTVAKEIELEDPIENIGAQMVKEVASKTADIAGDGTTTATVLAQAMISEGLKNVAAGANPMDLKRGIDKAVVKIVEGLKSQSVNVKNTSEKIRQIATVSANNDSHVGDLIAEAMAKVGMDGVIKVEQAKNTETTVTVVNGLQFDRGYISPFFVNNQEKMEVEMANPLILVCDHKISTAKDMVPILEKAAQAGRPLVIIAEDIDGEALPTLLVNKMRGAVSVAAVKAPGFGERRKDNLYDIAILTGAELVSNDFGLKLESVDMKHFGSCESVTIDKDKTTIVGGNGDKDHLQKHITAIKAIMKPEVDDFDQSNLRERLAKLSGGVAVLYVGAATEVEMKEKKDRVDDALHATRAAVQEGIVPGGGVAYIRAREMAKKLKGDNDDETTGISIVMRAIEQPLRTIVENAGLDGSVIINQVVKLKQSKGYNARSGRYEDMIQNGVIDPAKVSRVALENAASVAGMVLTTECVIADKPDPKQAENQQQGNSMGYM